MADVLFDTSIKRDQIIGVHDLTFTSVTTQNVMSSSRDTNASHYPLFDLYIQPQGTDLWMPAPPKFNGSPYQSGDGATWNVDYYQDLSLQGRYNVFGGTAGQTIKAKLVEYMSDNLESVSFQSPQETKMLFDSRELAARVQLQGEILIPKASSSTGIQAYTVTHNLGRIVEIKAWRIWLFDDGTDDVYSMQPFAIDNFTWPATSSKMDLNSVTFYATPDTEGPAKIIWRIYEDADN